MLLDVYFKEGHNVIYLLFSVGILISGGLILGFTNSNHSYGFNSNFGLKKIHLSYTGAGGITQTNLPNNNIITITPNSDTVFTSIEFEKGKLNYNSTSAGRGLITAGVLTVVFGSLLFIMSIAHIIWYRQNSEPRLHKSASMLIE